MSLRTDDSADVDARKEVSDGAVKLASSFPTKAEVVDARQGVIGFNVAVNYKKLPLYIIRGFKQYLYDETGAEYLDCVNNVCHVGHCHPEVVKAICDQVHELNTNSRYLSPYIVEYSKRLGATMPGDLKVCFWVNSGSEANDLALRLARAHTKRRGVMCVDGAYHGHLNTLIDISPYKYVREGGTGQRGWVKRAPIPDVHSGIHRGEMDDDAMGAAYAADVATLLTSFAHSEAREEKRRAAWRARKELKAAAKLLAAKADSPAGSGAGATLGHIELPVVDAQDDSDDDVEEDGLTAGCGAFIMESILSCGGQIIPPKGYLRRVYASVRAAGGVTIADEVQVGFGRVGEKFWAFQLQGDDVIPDIVTMGKPLGNGFPLALVVTTPAIARSFNNGMEYFNTFGGNPVAARAALAVMDVIEKEGLQAHAAHVGKVLLAGFQRLHAKYPVLVGSVRGIGLMVGMEFVHDAVKRTPWADGASAVVYAMRKRRILLSTDGMSNNIVKLKPPMVFSEANAEAVVRELDDILEHFDEHLAAYHAM